jgi:hypothetical protein
MYLCFYARTAISEPNGDNVTQMPVELQIAGFFVWAFALIYGLAYANLAFLRTKIPQLDARKYLFKFVASRGLYFDPEEMWKKEKIFNDDEIKLIMRWQFAVQVQIFIIAPILGIITAYLVGWN